MTQKTAEEILRKPKYNGLKHLVLIADAMDEFTEQLRQENASLRKQLDDYKEQAGIAIDERDEMLSSPKQEIEQKPDFNPKTEEEILYYVSPPKVGGLFTKDEAIKAMRLWSTIQGSPLQARIKELEQEIEERLDAMDRFDKAEAQWYDRHLKDQERIKELEASQSKWVSVTERLPEIDGFVMANDTDSLTPVKVLLFVHGNFYFEAHGVSMDYTNHISHWQPLPSKPE